MTLVLTPQRKFYTHLMVVINPVHVVILQQQTEYQSEMATDVSDGDKEESGIDDTGSNSNKGRE